MRFVVAADDAEATRRLDHLLSGFPDSPEPSTPTVTVTLERRRDDSGEPTELFDSRIDGDVVSEAMSFDDQAYRITRVLNERARDAAPDLLHLHSAAVARGGDVLVLAGRSGAGKSTLTAALLRTGWEYVTDEMVAARPSDGRVFAYPRPVTLRKGVWPSFPELAPFPDTPRTENQGARVEVSPLDLGAVVDPAARLSVVGLLFPLYTTVEPPALHAIPTAAECVERLASCCYDLERLGAAGLALLVEWAALGAAWQLDFAHLDDAVRQVEEAFTMAGRSERVGVRHLPAAVDGTITPGSMRRAPDAHAWSFADGSAVVFRPSTLKLGRIDAPGLQVWAHLREPTSLDALARELGADDPVSRASLEHWVERMVLTELVETRTVEAGP